MRFINSPLLSLGFALNGSEARSNSNPPLLSTCVVPDFMASTRLAAFACAIWSLKVEEELATFACGCVRGVGLSARSLGLVLTGATVGLLTVEVLKPVRESVVLDAAAEGVPGIREPVVPFGTLELASGFPMLLCCAAREVVCKGRGAATVALCLEGVLFTAA